MSHINTKCIQSGYKPKNGEPRILPIVQSTTYKYESADQMGRLFDLEEDGYFYTSVPYEQGWTLYVDGEEQEITPWEDAFIALEDLEAGTHEIEMRFVPAGFKLGAAITLSGLILFAAAIFLEKNRKNYKNKNHSY